MPFRQHTRHSTLDPGLQYSDAWDEHDAAYTNSEAPRTSPAPSIGSVPSPQTFMRGEPLPEDDEDKEYEEKEKPIRKDRHSDEQKAYLTLRYIRDNFSKFSLRNFLETCFESDSGEITNFVEIFMADGGGLMLMELLWEKRRRGQHGKAMTDWVIKTAGEECAKECSSLTDRASAGPHREDAEALRVSSDGVAVSHVRNFAYPLLLARYDRCTPHLQCILKAAIGKSGKPLNPKSRNTDDVRPCSFMSGPVLTNIHRVESQSRQ